MIQHYRILVVTLLRWGCATRYVTSSVNYCARYQINLPFISFLAAVNFIESLSVSPGFMVKRYGSKTSDLIRCEYLIFVDFLQVINTYFLVNLQACEDLFNFRYEYQKDLIAQLYYLLNLLTIWQQIELIIT